MRTRSTLIAYFITVFSIQVFAQDTTEHIIAGRQNSAEQESKPYVIMISIDGMRADYAGKFQAKNLLRLSAGGVRAEYMKPSYPSLTFPNHYTLVTGMYPAHHGLVDNFFYGRNEQRGYQMNKKEEVTNPVWYGGVPLWVLAERQKMVSASFYWVGSETKIGGEFPTHYYNYNTKISIDDRIQKVYDWLKLPAAERPHLITFYFSEVDHEAHTHGPESKEAQEAVHFVDESIGKMVDKVSSTGIPVNFIVVSDHGMTQVDATHPLKLPAVIDTAKFIIPRGDAVVPLYAKDKSAIKPTYEALKKDARQYDVYLRKNIPARWHYRTKDDRFNRIGDILLVPHLPYTFSLDKPSTTPGKHGYDPDNKDMYATFLAWGPAFKKGYTQPAFENVNVYPLVAHILGLPYKQKIDGKFSVVKDMLR